MSQSGRQTPTSEGSHPAVARGGSVDSTSSSQHSQSIKDIEDDIDALIQEVDQLGKEFIASTEEYRSSLMKARQVHRDARTYIFTEYLARLQDIALDSKPEDMKKQACEELQSTTQEKLREIQKRIDNKAKEIGAEGSGRMRLAVTSVTNRTKANAIRGNPEEIKKAASTSEGMQEIEKCRARLANAYRQVENKVKNSYQNYLAKLRDLTDEQKKIKETLDKKKIPEVPEDRAVAARTVRRLGTQDPGDYTAQIRKKNADDKKMNLLKK